MVPRHRPPAAEPVPQPPAEAEPKTETRPETTKPPEYTHVEQSSEGEEEER